MKEKILENKNIKTILLLHVLLFFYSLFGICSKLAAGYPFLSKEFIFFYGLVILNLGVYAICWQQIIKRIPLVTAFANKAITVIWGILWGRLFFQEEITVTKLVGAVLIVIGIICVVTSEEDVNG